jgi:hypothetical protein
MQRSAYAPVGLQERPESRDIGAIRAMEGDEDLVAE